MGIIDDYINGLEGKEDIDPLEVARDLHELHNQEIGTRDAKIEELMGGIAERDTTIADKDSEIKTWKAKNFDLAMQIPGTDQRTGPNENNDGEIDGATITIDDLFERKASL